MGSPYNRQSRPISRPPGRPFRQPLIGAAPSVSLPDRTFRLTALALALSAALSGAWPAISHAAGSRKGAAGSHGTVPPDEPVPLQLAPSLNLPLTSQENRELPVFGSADRMTTEPTPQGPVTVFEGDATQIGRASCRERV